MKNYNCRCYLKNVLIKGNVCYDNGSPIKNAIVFLEAFFSYKYNGYPIIYYKKKCGQTITNSKGNFCFLIYDTRCYYKIKVFHNTCADMNRFNCCVNLNQYIGEDLWKEF
jgi:hypothetical protein